MCHLLVGEGEVPLRSTPRTVPFVLMAGGLVQKLWCLIILGSPQELVNLDRTSPFLPDSLEHWVLLTIRGTDNASARPSKTTCTSTYRRTRVGQAVLAAYGGDFASLATHHRRQGEGV